MHIQNQPFIGSSGNVEAFKNAIFPIDVTPKGVETFTIEMDGIEQIETGTKEKNGKIVHYYKFKIIKK